MAGSLIVRTLHRLARNAPLARRASRAATLTVSGIGGQSLGIGAALVLPCVVHPLRCPVAAGARDLSGRSARLVAFVASVAAEKIDTGLRRALAGQLRSRASHPDSDGSGGAHVSLRSGQELVLSPRDRPRRTAWHPRNRSPWST